MILCEDHAQKSGYAVTDETYSPRVVVCDT